MTTGEAGGGGELFENVSAKHIQTEQQLENGTRVFKL